MTENPINKNKNSPSYLRNGLDGLDGGRSADYLVGMRPTKMDGIGQFRQDGQDIQDGLIGLIGLREVGCLSRRDVYLQKEG